MLTVMIEAGTEQAALGATLATLIPGAIEGLVREVVIIDRAGDPGIRKVADHAGCRLVTDEPLGPLVASARGEWLLLIEPGARLSTDWIESVTSHFSDVAVGTGLPQAARFTRARRERGGLFARVFEKRTALAEGLLLTKAQAVGVSKRSASLEEMGRGIATRRLEAAIRPRPKPGRGAA